MPITLTCPQCNSKLSVADDLAGKKVKCPKCSAVLPAVAPEQGAITKEKPPAKSEGIAQTVTTLEAVDEEEAPRARRISRDIRHDPDADAVSTIIPYKNGRALAAYYLGVFSLIPCAGLLLGPAAFVLGILGLRYVKANPSAKGTGHAIAGIVLGGLTSLGNWGILLAILIMGGIAALNK